MQHLSEPMKLAWDKLMRTWCRYHSLESVAKILVGLEPEARDYLCGDDLRLRRLVEAELEKQTKAVGSLFD